MKLRHLILLVCWLCNHNAVADDQTPIRHLVIIWLKAEQPDARSRYIEASSSLNQLPGVIRYQFGQRSNISRSRPNSAVDDSFDLIIDAEFESRPALEAFLKNPQYLQIAQGQLKDLVDHYKVYDFELQAEPE